MTDVQNKNIAAHAAVERMLNVYFREHQLYHRQPEDNMWHITIDDSQQLTGQFHYWSAMGHHAYEPEIQLQQTAVTTSLAPLEVITKLCDKLGQGDAVLSERMSEISNDIKNSIARTAHYLAYREQQQSLNPYILSEQSLYLGHPFHPTPKSSVGFSEADLQRYAPECQAKFQLYYVEVANELIVERYVTGTAVSVNDTLLALAKLSTSELTEGYTLLPLHPFQLTVLQDNADFQQWVTQGLIKLIGERGHVLYPTSSVRTVFAKELNIYLKLPIQVKITNFVRTNDYEQVERTIDAAQVIAAIKTEYETAQFKLMFEQGYRALRPHKTKENFDLLANSAMIVREGIENYHPQKEIHVLASLFETMPHSCNSLLSKQLSMSKLTVKTWLKDYLNLTLKPMLQLFVNTGVSLEGHVQNSLIELKDGRPIAYYVRDLEGVCLSRKKAEAAQLVPQVVANNSPVVYSDEAAWQRFKYYIIVNHLGHLVATVGKHNGEELTLWSYVRDILQSWSQEEATSAAWSAYVMDLYNSPVFAAKANLISKIHDCGENPIYTDIPNPIAMTKEVQYDT
nr:IucA/IucC family protein [Staphylococcus arlettae]